jgi:hypothetical protein
MSPLSPSQIVEMLALPKDLPQSGPWVVSGVVNGCFPNQNADPVLHSDYFLGTGLLTVAEDRESFSFTGGPGGTSVHTLIAPDTYFFSTNDEGLITNFTTVVVDTQTMVTTVQLSYVAGDGNCMTGATWTWSPLS